MRHAPCKTEYATFQSIPLFQECSYRRCWNEREQFNMKVSGFGTPRWRSAAGISQNAATAPFNLGDPRRYHNYQQHEHAITILFSLDIITIITMVILIEHKGTQWRWLSTTRMRGSEIYLRPTAFRLDKYKELAAQHRPSTTQHNTDQVLNTKDVPGQALPMLCTSSPGFGDLSQGFFLFWWQTDAHVGMFRWYWRLRWLWYWHWWWSVCRSFLGWSFYQMRNTIDHMMKDSL